MCQTIAYIVEEGKEIPVLQDVVDIVPGAGTIRMVSLFGEEKVVSGRIRRIDLLTHRVIIESE
jgi:predicted RNA-binding protein